jgi:hypothetical protein
MKVKSDSDVRFSVSLFISDEFQNVYVFDTTLIKKGCFTNPGANMIECNINLLQLLSGDYFIKCGLNIHGSDIID